MHSIYYCLEYNLCILFIFNIVRNWLTSLEQVIDNYISSTLSKALIINQLSATVTIGGNYGTPLELTVTHLYFLFLLFINFDTHRYDITVAGTRLTGTIQMTLSITSICFYNLFIK